MCARKTSLAYCWFIIIKLTANSSITQPEQSFYLTLVFSPCGPSQPLLSWGHQITFQPVFSFKQQNHREKAPNGKSVYQSVRGDKEELLGREVVGATHLSRLWGSLPIIAKAILVLIWGFQIDATGKSVNNDWVVFWSPLWSESLDCKTCWGKGVRTEVRGWFLNWALGTPWVWGRACDVGGERSAFAHSLLSPAATPPPP